MDDELRAILVESPDLPFVHTSTAEAIQTVRDECYTTLVAARGTTLSPNERRRNTFAGGPVNQILQLALALLGDWKVVADDYSVGLPGPGRSSGGPTALLPKLTDEAW